MQRSTYFLFLLLAAVLLLYTPMTAQQGLAHAGPDGIYVDLGNDVLPASIDGRDIRVYRIERREARARQWTSVADVSAPASLEELETAFANLRGRFGEMSGVRINVQELWQRMQTARDLRSIGVATRLLPVQLALGVRWHDTGAERVTPYEYRISHVDADGRAHEAFITPAVAWPGFANVAGLRMRRFEGEATVATVEWTIREGNQPTSFRVFRRQGLSGPFSELSTEIIDSCCYVAKGLIADADTLIAMVQDKTVERGLVYQYYAIPQDYFLNNGRVSDTVTVVTFRMAHVPLPERMKVRSVDTAGLLLRWQLRETSAIHGIVIERGPKIDSGFVALYTAAPTDTNFLDISIDPMTRYYYRLRLVGPGGLLSPPSAVLIGIWKSSDEPLPPQNVSAEAIDGGVRIRWDVDDLQYIEGYEVHRAEGYGMEFRQVSPLLTDMQGVYIDTSSLLRGDITYMYAVLAKNTSHMYSAMSDTVYSTPRLPVVVDAPQGMSARVDKENIYVNWRSTFDTEPVLSGYRVYRREGSAVWTALADTLQDAEQNHVLDEQVQPGVRYEYAVRAYSISGDSSAMSSVASAVIPLPSIYPPGNIRAFRQGAAIILQWDEIAQPSAKEFRIYRYTRGSDARLLGTVPLDTRVFLDDRPGDTSPLFYYLTTVGSVGNESNPSKEVAVR